VVAGGGDAISGKCARAAQPGEHLRYDPGPAKLGGCAQLSLTWAFGCPVGVGWVGPGLGVGSAGLLVRALGKYLDPVKKEICVALRSRHMGY